MTLCYDRAMDKFKTVQSLIIDAERVGQRLDNFLIRLAKGVPKSRIYRAIRKGEVRINKKRAKAQQKLAQGDVLRIPPLTVKTDEPQSLNSQTQAQLLQAILYEDDEVLVLNKPARMAVHGGSETHFSLILALRQLRPDYAKLELVHRLDKDTSGCLLLAKNYPVLKNLQQQFMDNDVEKLYYCLCQGTWAEQQHVTVPLAKRTISNEQMVVVDDQGKSAHTEFHCLEQYHNACLLSAKLHTGRTHQIRVHCKHLANVIAGDVKYGDKTFNKNMREFGLRRLFLHAYQIKFCLPNSKKPITVTAPLERELLQCLQNLEKYPS